MVTLLLISKHASKPPLVLSRRSICNTRPSDHLLECFIVDNRVSSAGVYTPRGFPDWWVLVDCRALASVIGGATSDSGSIRADSLYHTTSQSALSISSFIASVFFLLDCLLWSLSAFVSASASWTLLRPFIPLLPSLSFTPGEWVNLDYQTGGLHFDLLVDAVFRSCPVALSISRKVFFSLSSSFAGSNIVNTLESAPNTCVSTGY